jgi:hypothetical protein
MGNSATLIRIYSPKQANSATAEIATPITAQAAAAALQERPAAAAKGRCLDFRQTRFLVEFGFLPLVASLAESPKVLNRVSPAFRDRHDVIYFQCNMMVT